MIVVLRLPDRVLRRAARCGSSCSATPRVAPHPRAALPRRRRRRASGVLRVPVDLRERRPGRSPDYVYWWQVVGQIALLVRDRRGGCSTRRLARAHVARPRCANSIACRPRSSATRSRAPSTTRASSSRSGSPSATRTPTRDGTPVDASGAGLAPRGDGARERRGAARCARPRPEPAGGRASSSTRPAPRRGSRSRTPASRPSSGRSSPRCRSRARASSRPATSERRRIERDLHDGAQQRLVALALELRGRAEAARRPTSTPSSSDVLADARRRAAARASASCASSRAASTRAILTEDGPRRGARVARRPDADPGADRRGPAGAAAAARSRAPPTSSPARRSRMR